MNNNKQHLIEIKMETVEAEQAGQSKIDPGWKFIRSTITDNCVTTKSIFIHSWYRLLNKLNIGF